MTREKIIISAEDRSRLEAFLNSPFAQVFRDEEHFEDLQAELNRAEVVAPEEVPPDVVTMNSTVELRDLDTEEIETYTLVYPDRADIANQRLSILAPIGTAILGYRVGDEVLWNVPAGERRLKVESVVREEV